MKKVLYLADRNVLVDQSIQQDFKPLNKTIHKVNYQQDLGTGITAYEVYFALYQQLIGQGGKQNYKELFRPEFFDMVIVDAPPVGIVIDAPEIAKSCDGSALVLAYNKTRIRALQDAYHQMSLTGTPVLGCILNKVWDAY